MSRRSCGITILDFVDLMLKAPNGFEGSGRRNCSNTSDIHLLFNGSIPHTLPNIAISSVHNMIKSERRSFAIGLSSQYSDEGMIYGMYVLAHAYKEAGSA